VIIIASISLIVSTIVGINVIDSSQKSNQMLEQSILLLNQTHSITQTQYETEHSFPFVEFEPEGIILNYLEEPHGMGAPDHFVTVPIEIKYFTNHLATVEIVDFSFNPTDEYFPECIFNNELTTHYYSSKKDTLETIGSWSSKNFETPMSLTFSLRSLHDWGSLADYSNDSFAGYGTTIDLGDIQYTIELEDLQTEEKRTYFVSSKLGVEISPWFEHERYDKCLNGEIKLG